MPSATKDTSTIVGETKSTRTPAPRAHRATARAGQGNTPTGAIEVKLGRTEDAIAAKAAELNISLAPANRAPYGTTTRLRHASRRSILDGECRRDGQDTNSSYTTLLDSTDQLWHGFGR